MIDNNQSIVGKHAKQPVLLYFLKPLLAVRRMSCKGGAACAKNGHIHNGIIHPFTSYCPWEVVRN